MNEPISRRTLIRGAAAAGAVTAGGLTYASLPAWARTFANEQTALRKPLSLPYPKLPAGKFVKSFAPEIEHVVVLMMENHSFDNLLGMVPHQVKGRSRVDGLTVKNGKVVNSNPTSTDPTTAPQVTAYHGASPCQPGGPDQSWDSSHTAWNNGKNNGFVQASGTPGMTYWDKRDIPFTYSLVEHYPIGQRYFCSTLAQTYPNRRFLFCGTASGLTDSDTGSSLGTNAQNGTIFNWLLEHGIGFKDYVQPVKGFLDGTPLIVPEFFESHACIERVVNVSEFYKDAAAGKLPAFSFIDPNYDTTSEENPQDIQVGEQFVAKIVHAVTHSPNWRKTALFITYDEHGGYYDHVPPPTAILPDDIAPIQADANQTLVAGTYNRYGFRVPMIVVSPWARQHYVSNIVQDHTSITAFIQHKWNLPAMSARDANAHPLTDYFDFKQPAFMTPPKLAAAPTLTKGLAQCHAAGQTPPSD